MELIGEYSPRYKIVSNSVDVSALLATRLVSLSVTDSTGMESDELEIVYAFDHTNEDVAEPPEGTTFQVWLGYAEMTFLGTYVFAESQESDNPWLMTIRAQAALFDNTPLGGKNMQAQHRRAWPDGTTLGQVVTTIAAEHGLAPAMALAPSLIKLPYLEQLDESNLHFLMRLAKTYDVVIKPVNTKLVLVPRGLGVSATGVPLPPILVSSDDVVPGSIRRVNSRRETAGSVHAYWQAIKKAKRNEIKVGEGEPVTRIRQVFPTEDMALAAARARLATRARKKETLSLTFVQMRPDVIAEAQLTLVGYPSRFAGLWTVSRVQHALNANDGTTTIECERVVIVR
jgi:phage protein D